MTMIRMIQIYHYRLQLKLRYQAADQAWDLAIAQRTARFAALVDRFDQVVHATVHKETES